MQNTDRRRRTPPSLFMDSALSVGSKLHAIKRLALDQRFSSFWYLNVGNMDLFKLHCWIILEGFAKKSNCAKGANFQSQFIVSFLYTTHLEHIQKHTLPYWSEPMWLKLQANKMYQKYRLDQRSAANPALFPLIKNAQSRKISSEFEIKNIFSYILAVLQQIVTFVLYFWLIWLFFFTPPSLSEYHTQLVSATFSC